MKQNDATVQIGNSLRSLTADTAVSSMGYSCRGSANRTSRRRRDCLVASQGSPKGMALTTLHHAIFVELCLSKKIHGEENDKG